MKGFKFIAFTILIQFQISYHLSFSQSNYQLTIGSNEDIQRVNGFIDNEGNTIISGYNLILNNNFRTQSFIYKLNQSGEILDSLKFIDDNGYDIYVYSVLQAINNRYYVFSLVSNDTVLTSIKTVRIYKLKNNFELEAIKNFLIPYDDYFYYNAFAQVENDSTFLCVTTIRHIDLPEISFNSLIYKIDLQMDTIQSKRITDHRNVPFSILSRPNSYYKLFTILYRITPSTLQRIGQVIKMDTQFNIISVDSLACNVNSNPTVRFLDDRMDKYITAGKVLNINIPNPPNWQIGTMILNQNDSVISMKQYGKADTTDYPAWSQSLDFINPNEIFFGGTTNFCIPCGFSLARVNQPFILIKTDSLLNTQFEYYYDFNANLNMFSVIATPDGGCIMLGTIYDSINAPNNKHDIFILKVDANGMFTNTKDAETGKISEAIIGPNPGNDFINVIVAQQIKEPVIFEMFDFTGKKVLQETIQATSNTSINTALLKPGIYFYKIKTSKKEIGSGKWVKI